MDAIEFARDFPGNVRVYPGDGSGSSYACGCGVGVGSGSGLWLCGSGSGFGNGWDSGTEPYMGFGAGTGAESRDIPDDD